MTRIVLNARSKYGNTRAEEDGYRFDSQAELRRYRELKLMAAAGEVWGVQVHPTWRLEVNGVRIGRYTADFFYTSRSGDVVEDVKPAESRARSRDYVLRKKLMSALFGIAIREVQA